MSTENLQKIFDKIQNDEAFSAALMAKVSEGVPAILAFIQEQGFELSPEEIALAAQKAGELGLLSDGDLTGVSGGATSDSSGSVPPPVIDPKVFNPNKW